MEWYILLVCDMWNMVQVVVSMDKDWSMGYLSLVMVEVCYLFIDNLFLRGLLCITVSNSELICRDLIIYFSIVLLFIMMSIV